LKIGEFSEARKWQIASDAVQVRAKTATFLAGTYSGGGAAGQNSNTNQTFSSFSFRLAEKGVSIKNAYVILEAQFEAYANNAGNYSSSSIAFDTCSGACAPAAYTGVNNVSKFDDTVLAYDEGESNQIRLLLDVSNEGQLAAYTGENALMTGQVGYRFDRTAAVNSISYAKALLVLTYTYDPTTSGITNTVYYPLDSVDSSGGTKATSTADDCVLNNSCPLFSYNMELPEFTSASSTKLSQWFTIYNRNYNNGASDVTSNVNIQGTDINSSNFVHESALSDQTNMPPYYFSSVSGYAENSNQLLEYRATSPGAPTYYLIGGEVAETYTASTSAATSTRTVSFPIGVVSNGNSTATNSASVDIYFPENGTATGTVKIKKAWLRILSADYSNVASTYDFPPKQEITARPA
jgi:hypothetical protein